MSGTAAAPEGITNPPIDELLAIADSKYSLVIYAAKRARQLMAGATRANLSLHSLRFWIDNRPQTGLLPLHLNAEQSRASGQARLSAGSHFRG